MQGMREGIARVAPEVDLYYAALEPLDVGCPEDKCRNDLVVFVHGFPELHISWRAQMRAVAQAGFRTVAPDMRGYGKSSTPRETTAYGLEQLTGDLNGLLDHFGVKKAYFVGHDWGGMVVWAQVFHHPDRCLGVISLNTPVSLYEQLRPAWEAAGCKGPMEYMLTQPSESCGQLDYSVYFNQPNIPEQELETDIRRTIYAFFRSQVSGDRRKDQDNMRVGMRTGKVRKDNNRGVLYYAPSDIQRDPLWSEEEMDEYINAFSRTGFTPPLNWYRNIDKNVAWDHERGVYQRKVKVPCLMVTAEHDAVLTPEASRGMEALFEHLDREHVVAGHWVQREVEADINRILATWLLKQTSTPQSPASRM
mmetsp:Transcript_12908/g.25047  ORF Transcript_12908/g.25047 Transcript_12908/m.25047 type:complete len:363 (+) Transcript_12908:142-1230(+)